MGEPYAGVNGKKGRRLNPRQFNVQRQIKIKSMIKIKRGAKTKRDGDASGSAGLGSGAKTFEPIVAGEDGLPPRLMVEIPLHGKAESGEMILFR